MSHSHGSSGDETVNVNNESITVLTEAALAVGSTEVLGGCFLTAMVSCLRLGTRSCSSGHVVFELARAVMRPTLLPPAELGNTTPRLDEQLVNRREPKMT